MPDQAASLCAAAGQLQVSHCSLQPVFACMQWKSSPCKLAAAFSGRSANLLACTDGQCLADTRTDSSVLLACCAEGLRSLIVTSLQAAMPAHITAGFTLQWVAGADAAEVDPAPSTPTASSPQRDFEPAPARSRRKMAPEEHPPDPSTAPGDKQHTASASLDVRVSLGMFNQCYSSQYA